MLLVYDEYLQAHPGIKVKMSHYRHEGTKGKRIYSSYLFFISALRGVRGQRHAQDALCPRGKETLYPQATGWASELVWTQRLQEKFFASAGDRTPVV
jgi:hypothetical protein